MRMLICLGPLMLAPGCSPPMSDSDTGLVAVKCPPQEVGQETLEVPEWQGERYNQKGVRKLVVDMQAAIDSRDAALELWQDAWEECG